MKLFLYPYLFSIAKRRPLVLSVATLLTGIAAYLYFNKEMSSCEFVRFYEGQAALTEIIREAKAGGQQVLPTIVTAFFDIGEFQKGNSWFGFFSFRRGVSLYQQWAMSWSKILNPIIVYSNSNDVLQAMANARGKLLSKLVLLNTSDLDVYKRFFQRTADLYAKQEYPKFFPNTVLPMYPIIMHAKFELLMDAIKQHADWLHGDVVAWVDFGYFRGRYDVPFGLVTPPRFDHDKIAINQIYAHRQLELTEIIPSTSGRPWVGGGMVMGHRHKIVEFAEQYFAHVEYFLQQDLTSTDQEIIYAMFSGNALLNQPATPARLQTYWVQSFTESFRWFYLGNLARNSWLCYVDMSLE